MARPNRDYLGPSLGHRAMALAIAVTLLWLGSPALAAGSQQKLFVSPEKAVEALVDAARGGRTVELLKVLGPAGKKLVFSGDPVADREGRTKFVEGYDKTHRFDRKDDGKMILVIGDDGWPFPIPIVQQGAAWRFDTRAAAQEILDRRIGRNELSSIEVCRAYVDAQREYATVDRNGDGILEYAQKFVSRPGREDGLYWPAKPGAEQSPLGPLVAQARAEGYGGKSARGKRQPYHGYYYKILKTQGKNAPGGAYSYLANGRMIGGFALVAFPARYGASGIMTFIVNQDGIVYEKNLGPNTARIARRMTIYNPDASWKTP